MREKFIEMVRKREEQFRNEGWTVLREHIGWRMAVLTLRRPPVEKKVALLIPYEVFAYDAPFTKLSEKEVEKGNMHCDYCGKEITDDNWGYEHPDYPKTSDWILCKECCEKEEPPAELYLSLIHI